MKLKIFSLYLFLAFGLLSFSACEKENLDLTTTEEEVIDSEVISCNLTINIGEQPPGSGMLYAAASGGTTPYTFEWSTGETEDNIRVEEDGTYSVTVTDAEGCTATTSVTVTITVDPCDSFDVVVSEDPDGTLTTTISGGTAPYAFEWSTGETTSSITPGGSGTYTVTITDAEGCVVVRSIMIEDTPNCDGLTLSVEEDPEGVFTATATGGTEPYIYLWSNGVQSSTVTLTVSGAYTVRVIDAEGCTTDLLVTYTSADPCGSFIANIGEQPPGSGMLYAAASGGVPPYVYLWSTGETTSSINGSAGNTYSVTITDTNGCVATNQIQL